MSFSKYSNKIDIDIIKEIENDIVTNKRIELIIDRIELKNGIYKIFLNKLDNIFGKDYYNINKLMKNPSLKGIMEEKDSIKFLYTIDLKKILALFNFIGIKKNRGFLPIEDIVPDNLLGYEKISEWAKNEEYLYSKNVDISFTNEMTNINISIHHYFPPGVKDQSTKIFDEITEYFKKMSSYNIEYTRYDLIQNFGIEFIKFLCLMVEIINYNWMLLNPHEGLVYLRYRDNILPHSRIDKYKLRHKPVQEFGYIESNLRNNLNRNNFVKYNKCSDYTSHLLELLNNKINNMIMTKKCNKIKNLGIVMEKLREFRRQEISLERQIKNYTNKMILYKDSNGFISPDKMDDHILEEYLKNVSEFEKEKKNLNNIALELFKNVKNI